MHRIQRILRTNEGDDNCPSTPIHLQANVKHRIFEWILFEHGSSPLFDAVSVPCYQSMCVWVRSSQAIPAEKYPCTLLALASQAIQRRFRKNYHRHFSYVSVLLFHFHTNMRRSNCCHDNFPSLPHNAFLYYIDFNCVWNVSPSTFTILSNEKRNRMKTITTNNEVFFSLMFSCAMLLKYLVETEREKENIKIEEA